MGSVGLALSQAEVKGSGLPASSHLLRQFVGSTVICQIAVFDRLSFLCMCHLEYAMVNKMS